MKQVYNNKGMCSGCTACREICPVGAINMEEDEEGFIYPKIEEEKCINCGKCQRECAFNRKNIEKTKLPRAIMGVKIKDKEERKTSRSGGMFIAMANHIIETSGVVYGCKLGDNLEVHHSKAKTKEEVDGFKGSKYVKSNLKDVYKEVKEDLKEGKKVLFSGTSCEIAGLNTILKDIDTTNLYTCDIICHGVPSPLIYKEFIKFMESRENDKILSINFRDKNFGWSTHKETLVFKDKKVTTNYYTELFYSHYILRPSCYNCQFSNMDRVSDITIGDFWGIEKENETFYDDNGISLILVNTLKGQKMLESIIDKIHYIPVYSKHYMQHNLQYPSVKPENRDEFWKDYKQNEFEYIMNKYAKYK